MKAAVWIGKILLLLTVVYGSF